MLDFCQNYAILVVYIVLVDIVQLVHFIGGLPMFFDGISLLNFCITAAFTLCYLYQFLYLPVPLLAKDPPRTTKKKFRYAILIAARNEEAVISHLLNSIRDQDYPKELITAFVMADNCTDSTARIARDHGAIVYERFDTAQVGKGYALDALLNHIQSDYGDYFDAYLVFDADNLLSSDYITQMNRVFSDGYEIITSYRNSKNYGDNWISAGYALWFLREAESLNHARMLLGTSCAVSGTGFLFSRNVLKHHGGWHFHLLTEDIQFTIASILDGYTVGYCANAVFFDEQPTTFQQSWHQRLRWAKGYLQVFRTYGWQLLRGIFRKKGFACFDMMMSVMPAIALTMTGILTNLVVALVCLLNGQDCSGIAVSFAQMLFNSYSLLYFLGAFTTLTQWRQIRTTAIRKIFYTFTFPVFMLSYIPISFLALFRKVEWTPIKHCRTVPLSKLTQK